MANPQAENGHTDINHEDLEKLYSCPLSGGEFRIIFCVIRHTWGWHKKIDKLSIGKLVTKTKLSRKSVCETVNKLVTKRLLVKDKTKYINQYEFNKNWEEWVVTERPLGSYQKVTGVVTERPPKLVTKRLPTKEKKETITKETSTIVLEASPHQIFRETWNKVYGKNPTGGKTLVEFPIGRLIKAYTVEKVCGAILWAEQARKYNNYIPVIKNPKDLEDKWNSIVAQKIKEDKNERDTEKYKI